MYKYAPPKPILIDLSGRDGFELRKAAAEFVKNLRMRGQEAGSEVEQSYGILAEMAMRNILGMPEPNADNRELGWDLKLPSGVKVDVKCRGGILPFQELYEGTGGFKREAKHNFFARQVWDDQLDTDIYLMTHLQTPRNVTLPGTIRQRNWNLYVCGWVSKDRVKKEGIYLPRGAITEQGSRWFPYRSHEIEFYNQYLNGLANIENILTISKDDVLEDAGKPKNLHLTSVDATRIVINLIGYGVLKKDALEFVEEKLKLDMKVPPILHPNQYHYLLKWLRDNGKATDESIQKLSEIMEEVAYSE